MWNVQFNISLSQYWLPLTFQNYSTLTFNLWLLHLPQFAIAGTDNEEENKEQEGMQFRQTKQTTKSLKRWSRYV